MSLDNNQVVDPKPSGQILRLLMDGSQLRVALLCLKLILALVFQYNVLCQRFLLQKSVGAHRVHPGPVRSNWDSGDPFG